MKAFEKWLQLENPQRRAMCSTDKVILGGMSANLCVEAHLRDLIEQGFEVAVVKDATAAAQTPDIDGYAAAVTNFRFLASTVWTTDQAKSAMATGGN